MARRKQHGRADGNGPAKPLVAVAVRLTADVVSAMDEVAADLSRAAAGLRVSRSDVVRVLIGEALEARATRAPR